MNSASLRHRLRHATGDAHACLDTRLSALDLTDRAGYRRFLEINAAALMPLEHALEVAGVGGFFPDWPQRTRRLALLHDVARLDGTVEPVRVPLLRDAGSVLGVMYVLEGSRLGARVLLKEVLASPDAAVVAATRYLRHGEGENLWPSFLAQLEAHAAALGDDGAAIAGARQAFEMFAQAAERAMQPARRLAPA